jgi:hypothetical protein
METIEISLDRLPSDRLPAGHLPTGPWLGDRMRNLKRPVSALVGKMVLAPLRFWYSSLIAIYSYLTVVASVSIYDFVLTVQYAECLEQMEENPIGRWIMGLDHLKFGQIADPTMFLILKALGTILVLAIMYVLFTRRTRIGHPVALGVASFQIVLACYLTCVLPER